MKHHIQPPSRQLRGSALVLVLFGCALCALMVVILMERVAVSSKSTAAYTQSSQLRSLSEMALNVVQAQIRDATTTNQTVSTPLAQRSTWASQPGAIRTYMPSGTLQQIYKLYSSDALQTTDPDLGKDVPADWFSHKSEYTDINEPATTSGTQHFPVLNPSAPALNAGASGITAGFGITNAPLDTGNPQANQAPMPVRWIYVLEDGTLCQLGDSRISRTTNPIIGRIAFWTDDETAKVNINTASASGANSFWDLPKTRTARSTTEGPYGYCQPVQNEYQRYPGHPAMVSLRSILGTLGGLTNAEYYSLSPYYLWGGSQDGTVNIWTSGTSGTLLNKQDHAYVTLDELLFQANPNTLRSQPAPAQIESLRFFLTSNSRASELNLFGQPRVTIWPISAIQDDLHRTAFDNLIAFDSTIGGKDYYFVRNFPLDPTQDYSSYQRNQALYAYLKGLTSSSVPGFGKSDFSAKYGADRDQILTEIFDYIRAGVNLNETYAGIPANFESYTAECTGMNTTAGTFTPTNTNKGAGFVVPIQIGQTRGSGRFPAITNVALFFVQHHPILGPYDQTKGWNPDASKTSLQAMLFVQTCTPMFGNMPWVGSNLYLQISNSSLQATAGSTSTPLFTGGKTPEIFYPPGFSNTGQSPGGYDGYTWTLGTGNGYSEAAVNTTNPMVSHDVLIPPGATTFSFDGSVDISLVVNGNTIQTYRAKFPSCSGPLPAISDEDFTAFNKDRSAVPWWKNRFLHTGRALKGDVLKGVNLSHGDARLALMANTDGNPYDDFKELPGYAGAPNFSHGLSTMVMSNGPYLVLGGATGSYVDLPYYTSPVTFPGNATAVGPLTITSQPIISSDIKDLRAAGWSGDFDNGTGGFPDGPFLNKPDEGSKPSVTGYSPYGGWLWAPADGFFSPLRQIPSPVMFGSLPTGVKAGIPWRTLLFCPNPADPGHVGFQDPPDHLLLDLFRMPVVEPLAISGPASTDGKINMNYAIAPFTYIRRASSWYALLDPLKFLAIPDNQSKIYLGTDPNTPVPNMRSTVDVAETLRQFDQRFGNNDIFHSATEVCSLFMVPQGSTLSDVKNLASGYWSTHRLTGDNSREKPYAELYPKLTTQSDTYRVHVRAQILPKSDALPAGKSDFVPLAEYRGSRLIERYIDPQDPRFSTVNPDTDNLNELYQFRILETSLFDP
jgi:hypothetical protein